MDILTNYGTSEITSSCLECALIQTCLKIRTKPKHSPPHSVCDVGVGELESNTGDLQVSLGSLGGISGSHLFTPSPVTF